MFVDNSIRSTSAQEQLTGRLLFTNINCEETPVKTRQSSNEKVNYVKLDNEVKLSVFFNH